MKVYNVTGQVIPIGIPTTLQFDTYATGSPALWDGIQHRYTPDEEGFYLVNGVVTVGAIASGSYLIMYVYQDAINEYEYARYNWTAGLTAMSLPYSTLVYCDGVADFIQLKSVHVSAGPCVTTTQMEHHHLCISKLF